MLTVGKLLRARKIEAQVQKLLGTKVKRANRALLKCALFYDNTSKNVKKYHKTAKKAFDRLKYRVVTHRKLKKAIDRHIKAHYNMRSNNTGTNFLVLEAKDRKMIELVMEEYRAKGWDFMVCGMSKGKVSLFMSLKPLQYKELCVRANIDPRSSLESMFEGTWATNNLAASRIKERLKQDSKKVRDLDEELEERKEATKKRIEGLGIKEWWQGPLETKEFKKTQERSKTDFEKICEQFNLDPEKSRFFDYKPNK